MPLVPRRTSERSRPASTFGRSRLLLLLALSSTILCCNGFTLLQPSLSPGSFSTRKISRLSTSTPPLPVYKARWQVLHVPIFQKKNDDDSEETKPTQDDDLDDSDSSPENKAPPPGKKKEPSEFIKGLQRAGLTLSFTWSYVNIALGALLSVGLLLNILGYGYAVTDHGLVIDTLDNMRRDQQFQKAVVESMKNVQ
jgi:hypothetical protein